MSSAVRTVHTVRTRGGRAGAAVAAVALLCAVPACGGGGGGSGGTAHGATTSPPAATSGPTKSHAPGGGPSDERAARAEVVANWQKVFSPRTSPRERTRLLQDGGKLQLLVQALAHDPRAANAGAKVSRVTFTSPTAADVTYTVLLKGRPVVRDAKGTSVLEGGTWKVSVTTVCALVAKGTSGSAC